MLIHPFLCLYMPRTKVPKLTTPRTSLLSPAKPNPRSTPWRLSTSATKHGGSWSLVNLPPRRIATTCLCEYGPIFLSLFGICRAGYNQSEGVGEADMGLWPGEGMNQWLRWDEEERFVVWLYSLITGLSCTQPTNHLIVSPTLFITPYFPLHPLPLSCIADLFQPQHHRQRLQGTHQHL